MTSGNDNYPIFAWLDKKRLSCVIETLIINFICQNSKWATTKVKTL